MIRTGSAGMRSRFEVPREVSFFNVAAMGPLLRSSRRAAARAIQRRAQPWRIGAPEWFDLAEARRAAFARLIGGEADSVALVPSASYGFAVAAANLPLRPGKVVLAAAGDFPSGLDTWRRAVAAAGARLRLVSPEAGESWTEVIVRNLTADVVVVSVSPVRWVDGAWLDLQAIAAATREVGAALVVDATQCVGAQPIDVGSLDPDFVVCAGYKWLLGPYGLGYLHVSPRRHEGRPVEENWISREGAQDFARLAAHRPDYRPGARRFDAGEQVGFELAPAALDAMSQIERWGVPRIAAALGAITSRIEALAADMGFPPIHSGPRAPHILSLKVPVETGVDAGVSAAGVHISRRGEGIRISPHLYVDDLDVQRLVDGLGAGRTPCL